MAVEGSKSSVIDWEAALEQVEPIALNKTHMTQRRLKVSPFFL